MNANYGAGLRGLIAQDGYLRKVVHFGHQQVFNDVSTYTCLLILQRTRLDSAEIRLVDDLEGWALDGSSRAFTIPTVAIGAGPWIFRADDDENILAHIRESSVHLETVTDRIFQGLKTGADKVFIAHLVSAKGKTSVIRCALDGLEHEIESALLRVLIKGGDSHPFAIEATDRRIIFPYELDEDGEASLLTPEALKESCPLAWAYFKTHRAALDARESGKFSGRVWYQYSRNQALNVIQRPKIFTPDLAIKPSFAMDKTGDIAFTGGVSGGYGLVAGTGVDPRFLTGILNSRVSAWIVASSATVMRGGYFSFEARFIKSLPIPVIKRSDKTQKALFDRLLQLVDDMTLAAKEAFVARTDRERDYLQAKVATQKRQLDEMVFSLFGLKNSERQVIIQATNRLAQ
jgi:hypothetical protein